MAERNAELCLFCLEKDITILFNPETQAFCNISAGIKKRLLKLPAHEGGYGEIVIQISRQQVKNPGDFKNLFQSLKVGKFVKIQNIKKIDVQKLKKRRNIPPNIVILPTFGCNLRCSYCWNTYGTYGRSKEIMNHDTAVQTGKWLSSLIETGSDNNRLQKVEFFGGEPLLAPDVFTTITKSIHEAAAKKGQKVSITLVTNGLLFDDELIRFCRDHGVRICISLDGPEEMHNAMRVDVSGKGSHARVIDVIKRIQKIYPNGFQVRATVTPPYKFMSLCDYMHGLGISDFGFMQVTDERIGPDGGEILPGDYGLRNSRKAMFNFLNAYLDRLLSGDNVYYSKNFFQLVSAGLASGIKITPCGLGMGGPCVLPDGTFVTCFKFAFDPSRRTGDVWEGVDYEAVVKNMNFTASHSVWSYEPCRKCFARYKCGGPCYASNRVFNREMGVFCGAGCETNRELIITGFYAVALLQKKDPAMFKLMQENRGKKARKSLRQLFAQHYLHKAS